MSRTLALSLAAVAVAAPLAAAAAPQDQTREQLVALFEEKLAKPFAAEGPWMVDYEAALTRAQAEGKLLFVYYTRSYAP